MHRGTWIELDETAHHIEATDCSVPMLVSDAIKVAADYYTSADGCSPECQSIFPKIPAAPSGAGAPAPTLPRPPTLAHATSPSAGCSAVPGEDGWSTLALLLACAWRRRSKQ